MWIALDAASVPSMFKKLLHITFWMWFATAFPTVVKAFSDSLVQLGLTAGAQSGNVGILLDPSRIAGMALDATAPLVKAMDDAGFSMIKDAIVFGLCYLIIMACFFLMACQICLAVIEYYLVVTLATCLIPFGMSSHTKFIAEKAIGAAVAVSVKLMVLSFLVALIQPVLRAHPLLGRRRHQDERAHGHDLGVGAARVRCVARARLRVRSARGLAVAGRGGDHGLRMLERGPAWPSLGRSLAPSALSPSATHSLRRQAGLRAWLGTAAQRLGAGVRAGMGSGGGRPTLEGTFRGWLSPGGENRGRGGVGIQRRAAAPVGA